MKKIIGLSIVAVLIIGMVGGGTWALFTDEETSTGNSFTAGTVELTLGEGGSIPFTVGNMAPGDIAVATADVFNDGTLALRYAMTTVVDSDSGASLADQLTCTITAGGGDLYNGSLSGAFIGDPDPGDQGDDRELGIGGSEILTFTVTMPIDTSDAYQGASCSVNFTFNAEQTINNP